MTPATFSAPTPLPAEHDVAAFECGVPVLDDWLKRQAWRNEVGGGSRTFVVTAGTAVDAYYCLAAGAVVRDEAPARIRRNLPDPILVVVLGRLAVDRRYQGQGLGSALLRDAVLRVLHAADTVGIRAILVHAISEQANRFYLGAGFIESPIEPMTLCLVLDTARRARADQPAP